MNFILDNWYLIFLALASGALLLVPALKGGMSGGLTAAQAVQLINREKAVVIDVCEPQEYAAGHVNAAKNVPLAQLQERLPQVVKNKAVPVILVCAKGARSARAAGIARGLGYDKAQSLSGGLAAWREAGLPVEKT
ncbi:sulfurtransferase [Melaminivora suipulveris]|uniref:Sulfurtransferase n=1 Tax=Melaminivora suipulveris TaxID=2109913 RepID=A0A2R3QEC6_9BURK|nr:rhodanese-like domain-containing protein [Melaminivora suipulveris]AVO50007.1 sulfurtransferase [Melaminivora suipulveris]